MIFTTEAKKEETNIIPGPGDYKCEEVIDRLTRKGPSAIMPKARYEYKQQ